jgi:hypothetical protein
MKVQSRFVLSIAALLLTAIAAWATITTDTGEAAKPHEFNCRL